MVQVHFPILEIRKPKLKVRSHRIEVDFNDWCRYKRETRTDTQRHAQEEHHVIMEAEIEATCL